MEKIICKMKIDKRMYRHTKYIKHKLTRFLFFIFLPMFFSLLFLLFQKKNFNILASISLLSGVASNFVYVSVMKIIYNAQYKKQQEKILRKVYELEFDEEKVVVTKISKKKTNVLEIIKYEALKHVFINKHLIVLLKEVNDGFVIDKSIFTEEELVRVKSFLIKNNN